MTKSFAAQVGAFNEKAMRNIGLVVADAAQGVFEDMSQRQPSIKETGTFEVGKVPVDTGVLINSLFTTLNGFKVGDGPTSYVAGLAGFDAGDTMQFAFSSEYAPHIEYGTVNFSGRFMVREALNGEGGWQGRIDASARRIGGS